MTLQMQSARRAAVSPLTSLTWAVSGVLVIFCLALLFIRIAGRTPGPIADHAAATEGTTAVAESSPQAAHRRDGENGGHALAPPLVVDVSGIDPPLTADVDLDSSGQARV